MAMIPTYVLENGQPLPEDEICFIVGRDGLYLKKITGLVESVIRVKTVNHLAVIEEQAKLHLPVIPAVVFAQAYIFFRFMFKRMRTEMMVLIYYNQQTNEFVFDCPMQQVSYGGIKYESHSRMLDDFQLVGSFHTHADFSAGHSSIDHGDEMEFDGLHITIGHINRKEFTLSVSIVVNGKRFLKDPMTMIEGLKFEEERPQYTYQDQDNGFQNIPIGFRAEFMTAPGTMFGVLGSRYTPENRPANPPTRSENFYSFALPESVSTSDVIFPDAWVSRVKRMAFWDRAKGVLRSMDWEAEAGKIQDEP